MTHRLRLDLMHSNTMKPGGGDWVFHPVARGRMDNKGVERVARRPSGCADGIFSKCFKFALNN